ncbi:MAG: Fic family protein [Chthoniobacterales bacterium]
MVKYSLPKNWVFYDFRAIFTELTEAKAAILSLRELPSQRQWTDDLQVVQLKMEVAGTSRIEGADFTERELDAALREGPDALFTRSQKQAASVANAYRWIKTVPTDRPITDDLICHIHRLIITGADEDHCPPGKLRTKDENVTFGTPRHRGIEGGKPCHEGFLKLCEAVEREFKEHDPLIQALALHYHFAAMHPFLDGNGRTARVLESLMTQRGGLQGTLFIAMSNYYYEEKATYLQTLSNVRAKDHDLTEFLKFGLKGVAIQCQRLFKEIKVHVAKSLFRDLMYDLFTRMQNPRKRVIAKRQLELLKLFLEVDVVTLQKLTKDTKKLYSTLNSPHKALIRDLNELIELQAIEAREANGDFEIRVLLDWGTKMTESAFFEKTKNMATSKTHKILCQSEYLPPVDTF